jgi:hydroxymethylbilane synthase
VPAVGQGALAVEVRRDDAFAKCVVAAADDPVARAEAEAELALARALEVGCREPAGALARVQGNALGITAALCTPDGRVVLRAEARGGAADPEAVGRAAASDLLRQGGRSLVRRAVAQ